jgi:predicted AAA+ superfamily ATPase
MLINRSNYLNQLVRLRDNHLVKVITGVRGAGKSTLLMQYQNWLQDHGVSADQIVFLDFERFDKVMVRTGE